MAINNKKQYMTHQKYNILYNRVTIGWIQRQWCFKNKLNQNLKKKKHSIWKDQLVQGLAG